MPSIIKKVEVTIEVLKIEGVETHFNKTVWIDDEHDEKGGWFESVKQTYEHPMIRMEFYGTVNKELCVGNIYTDGVNKFMAVSTYRIMLLMGLVYTFEIPTTLVPISTSFSKGV